MDKENDIKRFFLRHVLATLAYRGGKVIANVPDEFRDYRINDGTRTPGEILAHIGDLMDWSLRLAKGESGGLNSEPLVWSKECERFYTLLKKFDLFLEGDLEMMQPAEKLLQGPLADAFTHVGQIAMLRRMAGYPVKGENYFKADIEAGRVGKEQSKVRFEFE
ncbi:MAG: hypothetical protein ACHQIH_01055 [Ignavibacteria bacterium]